MSFRSSVFALVCKKEDDVLAGDLQKVRLYTANNHAFGKELRSKEAVKSVILSLSTLAVVCETHIKLYAGEDLRPLRHLDTAPNPKGLCTLASSSKTNWMLCCPGAETGNVGVLCCDETASHTFKAHQKEVAALVLSMGGRLLATASDFGTVVKVFDPSNGRLLYRLRRSSPGIRKEIVRLTFSADERFLAVSSTSPKVHLFKFPASAGESSEVTKYASFNIPENDGGDVRNLSCNSIRGPEVAFHRRLPRLFVLHYNGVFYECSFDPSLDPMSSGGQECRIVARTIWFAVRHDFQVHTSAAALQTVPGGQDSDDGDDPWTLI
eukprot:CAMPEP_0178417472 /NCGR_PEP_ID=MMETSP0689_2-20121128/24591_1 /TAXON_ID=160604 /ORGANISM="Amphidinium massartii, Strain CS-259" /LENGTH=322 /DNA_ID=CAMNT_0020038837 /DNA_START=207 /DNA_END=1175 /DNA_ORIENTATION=+